MWKVQELQPVRLTNIPVPFRHIGLKYDICSMTRLEHGGINDQ